MQDFTQLSTATLIRRARQVALRDPTTECCERWDLIWELRRRPERRVFNTCVRWCREREPLVRILGVAVLAQLGYGNFIFAEESEPLLVECLRDPDHRVVAGALYAFGHLRRGDLPTLCAFVRHRSSDIRYALAFALGSRGDPLAIATLMRLTRDRNRDVRDWATFGLACQLDETDTPELREALAARLHDTFDEVRFEAVMGLGNRGDERARTLLLAEVQGPEPRPWVFDAIGNLPEAVYVPHLQQHLACQPELRCLQDALAACLAEQEPTV